MSDKDDMSEEVVHEDSEVAGEDGNQTEMGQIKSKLKKFRAGKAKKTEEAEVEGEELDFEGDDGDFMCGVVEGFYGRPWTTAQRKELFHRMKVMGMNTYLYGPKDDYKHRLYWRDLYSKDESGLLKLLIEAAEERDVLFIYAISPGLDMAFASPKELDALKNKLLQVQSLGCKAFALLFDDIDPILCASDKKEYESAGSAQASVTNQMYEMLEKPKFLFCPTEYCNSMAIPDVKNSQYLQTIGRELNRNISIMWTGPKVVSKNISLESIKQLTKIVRRKVVIWDNIHANDYDPKRVFLGPYKGRSTDLIPHLMGVLTNPNCEFESNFIAMHTLASWWKSYKKHAEEKSSLAPPGSIDDAGKKSDVEMAESDAKKSDVEKSDSEGRSMENNNTDVNKKTEEEAVGEKEMIEEVEKGTENDVEELEKDEHVASPIPKQENEEVVQQPSESGATSAMSSGVSSFAGSDDSDTDSDYSSHDEFFGRRPASTPPFDHGVYDPDESLKEAIRHWLPLFSTTRLPLGKPVARSGPPLGMLPQFDVTLTSNAPMGPLSSTTNVLSSDPILSTAAPVSGYGSSPFTPDIPSKPRIPECGDDGNKKNINKEEEGPPVSSGIADIEMGSSTPETTSPNRPDPNESPNNQDMDGKPAGDADVDMKPVTSSEESEKGKEERMQTGDGEEAGLRRSESSGQMETEEEELMQCEADHDSDVSMATNNSEKEKKIVKEELEDKDGMASLSGSSVDMTPPHQPSSLPQSPEHVIQATPDHSNTVFQPTDSGSDRHRIDQMTLDDISLAVELFYLPYEHGNIGRKMVQDFVWLQRNVQRAVAPPNATKSVQNENLDKALEWMERAIQFEDSCVAIRRMCNKLTACSNRALLYDLFPYFWDMKGVVSMLSSYVKWMGQFYLRHQTARTQESSETESNSSKPSSPAPPQSPSPSSPATKSLPPPFPQNAASVWLGPDPEPWAFRGGLSGEFQRLLPVTMANDLFCQVIPCSPQTTNTTYVIRPYLPSDEKSVYNICLTTGNDGTDFADDFTGYEELPGERLVGGLLTLSPEYCFVVEDEHGICGYLVGTADAKSFWKKYSIAFLPEVKEKYSLPKEDEKEGETGIKIGEEVRRLLEEIRSEDPPDAYAVDSLHTTHPAYMQIAVHRRVADPSIAKSMTVCMLSALKSHGVHGVHTTVRSSDCYMPDLYFRLGFHEIRPIDTLPVTAVTSGLSAYKDDMTIVYGRTF